MIRVVHEKNPTPSVRGFCVTRLLLLVNPSITAEKPLMNREERSLDLLLLRAGPGSNTRARQRQ